MRTTVLVLRSLQFFLLVFAVEAFDRKVGEAPAKFVKRGGKQTENYAFFFPARSMRSSIGLRPAKPSSVECQ